MDKARAIQILTLERQRALKNPKYRALRHVRECIEAYELAIEALEKQSNVPPEPVRPTIRHCKNCRWCGHWFTATDSIHCSVKYKHYINEEQRCVAILCKHYKRKDQSR